MKNALLTLSILTLISTSAFAETTWQVAPGPSSVKFKVQHMMFSQVEGKFKKIEGRILAPNGNLEGSQMEARIPVSSIYTGIDDRDTHLRSKAFFSSEEHPDIIFKSNSVRKIGEHSYIINGELTMRGVTKSIALNAKCEHERVLKNGKTRMDLQATGQISRYDYGLKWNQIMEAGTALVGEYVDISLKLALMKDTPEAS